MTIKFTPPFALSIMCLLSFSGCNSNSADNNALTYESAKLTIEQEEKAYPISFLTVDGTYRKNLIGEWVLEGKVMSKATVAKYKDVVLDISYYSKTETLLGTEKKVIYDYFNPGAKVKFKIKSFGYKGAKSVAVDIARATSVK